MSRTDEEARVRELRRAYDALSDGARATLRRCATGDELRAEGAFFTLCHQADVAPTRAIADVVACFPNAEDGAAEFPKWLRRTFYGETKLADLPTRALRFRRALAARDTDELTHHLRGLLRAGYQRSRRGVAWSKLGADMIMWSDPVRRRWAEQFFTEMKVHPEQGASDV